MSNFVKNRNQEVKPKINIWVGNQKSEIGGVGVLSETELGWLASELSDWPDLTVTQAA